MSTPENVADFEPGQILRALEAHHVRHVVIGAIAAIAQLRILRRTPEQTRERGREHPGREV